MNKKKEVVILGAGPAGLAAAYFYNEKGYKVTVIEKSNSIGGLSRGISFLENKYDLGPHSFYANYSEKTKQFFEKFIGKKNYSKVTPQKLIKAEDVLFHSPLQAGDLLKGKNLLFFGAYGFFRGVEAFSIKKKKNVIRKHGYWLRKKIFEPYCYKYFGISPESVSDDFIKLLYAESSDDEEGAIYITHAGYIGKLWENVYQYLQGKGVTFELNQQVTGIEHTASQVKSVVTTDKVFNAVDQLVSTIPLQLLHKLTFPYRKVNFKLNYRATVLVFLEAETIKTKALYLTDYTIGNVVGRVSFCSNWVKRENKPVISVEIWCNEHDAIFQQEDQEVLATVIDALKSMSVVKISDQPKHKIIRIPKCYPVLEKGYHKQLGKVKNDLQELSNLQLVGRHGKFQWDGIDDSINQ